MKILSKGYVDNLPWKARDPYYVSSDLYELVGKIFTKIEKTHETIDFHCGLYIKYHMFHMQDCCEKVIIDDINGDLNDLIGNPILKAEEVTNRNKIRGNESDSWTYTFYHFATIKGYVTIRWYGTSNGYYSESVGFVCHIKDVNK